MTWETTLKGKRKTDMKSLAAAVEAWSNQNQHREVTTSEVWEEIKPDYISRSGLTLRGRFNPPTRQIGSILRKLGWADTIRHGVMVFYWPTRVPSWQQSKIEKSEILASLDSKEKKKLKKTLQAASPSEYFGQDFNRLGTLVDMMEALDLVKSDKKLTKKMKSIKEQNVDMLATSSKLRKQYEQLYRQLRGIVYPKSKGTLRDKDERS